MKIKELEQIIYKTGILGHLASAGLVIDSIHNLLYTSQYKMAACEVIIATGLQVDQYFHRKRQQTIKKAYDNAVKAQKELQK